MSLAVLTAYTNPRRDPALRRNLFRWLRQMEAASVQFFIVELAYGDEPWTLTEAPNVLRLRTSLRNVMWSQENLINCLERIIPAEFEKLAWVSANIWFQNPNWYEETEALLGECAVAQLFDYVVYTSEDGQAYAVSRSFAAGASGKRSESAPGLAWAAKRELWSRCGGLIEQPICGVGEVANAEAFVEVNQTYEGNKLKAKTISAWCRDQGGCSSLPDTIWHEWHQGATNPGVLKSAGSIPDCNAQRLFTQNPETGLLEFSLGSPASELEPIQAHLEATLIDQVWMNYRELRAMAELLQPSDHVLEFGCGGSTSWLSRRVARVQSVEHDQEWAASAVAAAPENVTIHWRRPDFPHEGRQAAQPGQFRQYLKMPSLLQTTFDAILVDGRARVDAALAASPWIKPGGWLFFHDWFKRNRYTARLGELEPYFHLREELSITGTPQTLAVFERLP